MSKEIIPSPGGSNKFSRLISKIKAALGIVEESNTASHTIASGKFVTWKGDLYKAKSAIPSGTTLSSSNLQAVSEGGLNELSEQIANITTVNLVTGLTLYKLGRIRIISGINGSGEVPSTGLDIGETVATQCYSRIRYYNGSSNVDGFLFVNSSKLFVKSNDGSTNVSATYVTGNIVYFV